MVKQRDVTGSYVVATDHRRLSWAVGALLKRHAAKDLMKLKVTGGEHLAAILTTSCFGTPPKPWGGWWDRPGLQSREQCSCYAGDSWRGLRAVR